MTDLAVRAFDLGKRYVLGDRRARHGLLTERVAQVVRARGTRAPRREHWAVRDVDFEVERGTSFGIVGHNGAGKSTVLKILGQVTTPTTGGVDLDGRVGALLEVGTGFHAELTGAENVYLNGALLGMGRREVARRFDEIVAFAGVEEFIHTPVKRYSSGMYLRLAFAVAAHLEPDILIVDEVLSVGDLAFQEKCLDRMEAVAGEGRTVLFVSHNLAAVSRLCERSMLLWNGRKVADGATDEVLGEYVRRVRRDTAAGLEQRLDRTGSGALRFHEVAFEVDGALTDTVRSGDDVTILLRYRSAGSGPREATFSVSVTTALGALVLHLASDVSGGVRPPLPPEGTVRCRLPRLPLPAGAYSLSIAAVATGEPLDMIGRAAELVVLDGDFHGTGRSPSPAHPAALTDFEWSGPA